MMVQEQKLLLEAEEAATKCFTCLKYGRCEADCPERPAPPREAKLCGRTYYAEVRGFNPWLFVFWILAGYAAVVIAYKLWIGFSR